MKKLVFVLLLTGLVISLVIFRVPLIERLSPQLSGYYGVDIQQMDIHRFDADKIMLPQLVFQYVDDSMTLRVEIKDLVVDIDMFAARVSKVVLGDVRIDGYAKNSTSSTSNEQSVKDILHSLLIFPVKIEHLEIAYHIDDQSLLHFKGNLSYDEKAVLKGMLYGTKEVASAVNIEIGESNFSIILTYNTSIGESSNQEIINWVGHYQIEDDWLTVSLDGAVGVAQVNQILRAYGIEVYVYQDTTSITAEMEVDLLQAPENIMQSIAAKNSTSVETVELLAGKKAI